MQMTPTVGSGSPRVNPALGEVLLSKKSANNLEVEVLDSTALQLLAPRLWLLPNELPSIFWIGHILRIRVLKRIEDPTTALM